MIDVYICIYGWSPLILILSTEKIKKGKNIEHLRGPLVESMYMSPQDGTWPASAADSTIMRVGDRSMFHGDEPA